MEMSIFYVLLLFLITSDWINQQINGIPQGFDISSSILCDHFSKKGPRYCADVVLQIDFDSAGWLQTPKMEIDILT